MCVYCSRLGTPKLLDVRSFLSLEKRSVQQKPMPLAREKCYPSRCCESPGRSEHLWKLIDWWEADSLRLLGWGKKRKWQVKDGKCGYLVEPTMQYSRLACPQQISESRQRLVVPSCNWFFFCPACNRHLMQMLRTKESTIDIQLNYASFTIRGHLRKT